MNSFLSKIWFPVAFVAAGAAGAIGPDRNMDSGEFIYTNPLPVVTEAPDTIIYNVKGYKKGWEEDLLEEIKISVPDSLSDFGDSLMLAVDIETDDEQEDIAVSPRPVAMDTLLAPEALAATDSLRYKYYAALNDSLCRIWVRDSLINAGETELWGVIDSIYLADSTSAAELAFERWYAALDNKARRNYDREQVIMVKQARSDSLLSIKDSIRAYKDSVLQSTPRILETFALNDTLWYKRVVSWTRDRSFHKLNIREIDTTANYHFNYLPLRKEDVNATWLGVAGSPVLYYDFFKRTSSEGIFFYDALESWTYTVDNLHFFNTKTPFTELAYWGSLLADPKKESDNIHIFTSQNITPELNVTFEYNRYGGEGLLLKESTRNKTLVFNTNYIGKKYMMHAGYIYNMAGRNENGGITDNTWIRDTTVDSKELKVNLSDANSLVKKNTVFLDQQYRIPFNFLKKKTEKDTQEAFDDDVTTAFIGHSSEYTTVIRKYYDKLTDEVGRDFYNNVFNYNPSVTNDSVRVMRFDNKVFLRLQPWSSDGAVSKLDVGAGHKLMNYYIMDPTFLTRPSNRAWNATYAYAGLEGQIQEFVHWDAQGKYNFLGNEANDFNISANLGFNFYPFRKAKRSPVSVSAHFETSLREPEFYQQHYYSNHYTWENDFAKISTTKLQGAISIPRLRFKLSAGYSLLNNNVYYDTKSAVCQNTVPMSVFSARLDQDFVAGPAHFEHKILFQQSSNPDVLPLPLLSANLRYYVQFTIQKVLQMQIGINGFYNTKWYAPGYNPALGVFHNQDQEKYNNGPIFDAFVNMQWKRACIFVKLENAGEGWPMKKSDYFSADHYISTERMLVFGIFWPFYTQPSKAGNTGKGGQTGTAGRKSSSNR